MSNVRYLKLVDANLIGRFIIKMWEIRENNSPLASERLRDEAKLMLKSMTPLQRTKALDAMAKIDNVIFQEKRNQARGA